MPVILLIIKQNFTQLAVLVSHNSKFIERHVRQKRLLRSITKLLT